MLRVLFPLAALLCAAPAFAGAPVQTGPFALAPSTDAQPRGAVLVIDSAAGCSAEAAAAQAALAAAVGKTVGVVAGTDAACGAAAALLQDGGADLAFASDGAVLGEAGAPNAWLARRREAGIVVWDMAAYRQLNLPEGRQVLGVFEDRPDTATLIETALARLSQDPDGFFLLVQASDLDDAARGALDAARGAGASVIAAGGDRFSALETR